MDSSGLGSDGQINIDMDENVPKLFMCGLCQDGYSDLDVYLLHVKSHSGVSDKMFHICGNIPAIQTEKDKTTYQCRICCGQFASICLLHNHISDCTGDGSYIFDHSRNTAYPLSMHCAGFENRECELEENTECEKSASVTNAAFKAEAIDDKTLEKVDKFLNKFCSLKYIPGQAESNVRVSKRGRKPKIREDQSDKGLVSKTNKHKTIAEKPNRMKKVKLIPNKVQKTDTIIKTSERNENNTKKASTPKSDKKSANGLENVSNNSESIYQDNIGATDINLNDESAEIAKGTMQLTKTNTTDNAAYNYDSDTDDIDAVSDGTEINDENDGNKMLTVSATSSTQRSETDVSEINPMELERELTVNLTRINDKKFSAQLQNSRGRVKKKSKEIEVECPHCNKVMTPAKLKKHIVCHSDARPWKCDECPKTYKRRIHLETHKITHQDVKPFYCEFCGKGVLTVTILKHHVMFHHSETKPFRCTICDASFITNFKLQRHMNKHTGLKSFQCDLCGMGFATRYNLSVHIRGVHKKDLRFSCLQCDKSFMTNYQLKVHTMKHSGERPYKCAVCKADYVERKELRRHLKKNHNLLMENVSGYSEHMPHTDGVPEADMFAEEMDRYRTDNKPHISSPDMILAGNNSLITFPSIEMNQGEMYCVKNDQNMKLSPSKQLPTHSADVLDYSTGADSGAESMIPGVPLTVTSMNSSFMTVITDHDEDPDDNDKISYEHNSTSAIPIDN